MSFNIALSGINAVNKQLNSISNNLANTATYGYKSSRANFTAAYIGTQAGGVQVGSVSQSMDHGGNMLRTERGMDAAIQGRGFFVSRDIDGSTLFSRVGIFDTDKEGFVIDTLGRKVQGFPANGNAIAGDLIVPTSAIGAKASDSLRYAGNLSADWSVPSVTQFDKDQPLSYNGLSVSTAYDSLGRKHTLTQYYIKGPGNEVSVQYTMDGNEVGAATTLSFDTDGKLIAPAGNVALDLGTPGGASPMKLSLNYTDTTMFAGEMTTTRNTSTGYAAGNVTGLSLDENGSIIVQYSNGEKASAGKLAIATFPNESGLVAVSGSAWQASPATGDPLYFTAGSSMAGKLAVGALEQSNVDMTSELVNLMAAQQNYQANSKVITAENEMMRTLMQAL
ncbi:flagellar hook protein FlgE [Caballeronia sp. LjRoot31]|uniref:flagellar hook protein FlgE n=1 Tax=Caballeronia sp. LjRoot31 TaxID=3342324 RepID=UPI003ED0FA89